MFAALLVLLASPALAQVPPADLFDGRRPRLEAFGPLPAENSGATGPAMRGDVAFVLAPKRVSVSGSFDAANYLTDQGFDQTWLYQKFERQTVSLELRRGLSPGKLPIPGLEVGLRVDARRRTEGMLNGFIAASEKGMAAIARNDDLINYDRVGEDAYTGTGESIGVNGEIRRENDGRSRMRATDLMLTMKALLLQGSLMDRIPDVALRLAVDATNPAVFDGDGNYAGAGVSISQPLSRRMTAYADLRAMKTLGGRDAMGLPLKPWALGATAGIERRLDWGRFKNTSFSVQFSRDQSPYVSVGLVSFDAPRTDVTLGFSHLAEIGAQKILFQIYGREDFNPGAKSASMAPYSPPDLQMGLRAVWTPGTAR